MIKISDQSINLKEKDHIEKFEVWWTVPGLGLYRDLGEALAEGRGVFPTPVAVGKTTYEVLPPELHN